MGGSQILRRAVCGRVWIIGSNKSPLPVRAMFLATTPLTLRGYPTQEKTISARL